MARDHQVLDGRRAIVEWIRWLADQVEAGRVEAATATLAERDRLHCAVRLRGDGA